jgi:hypothetical protein
MKNRHITTIIAAALLLVATAACSKVGEAPSKASYRVTGAVYDSYGLPIKDIGVSSIGDAFRDTTDGEGAFEVTFVDYKPDLDTLEVNFHDLLPRNGHPYADTVVKVSFRGAVFIGGTTTHDGTATQNIEVILRRE